MRLWVLLLQSFPSTSATLTRAGLATPSFETVIIAAERWSARKLTSFSESGTSRLYLRQRCRFFRRCRSQGMGDAR
jgi:hypothetical protein